MQQVGMMTVGGERPEGQDSVDHTANWLSASPAPFSKGGSRFRDGGRLAGTLRPQPKGMRFRETGRLSRALDHFSTINRLREWSGASAELY